MFSAHYTADKLPNDQLPLTPPNPTDWDESHAGILDPEGTTLIDIDFTTLCSSPCGPAGLVPTISPIGFATLGVFVFGAAWWGLRASRCMGFENGQRHSIPRRLAPRLRRRIDAQIRERLRAPGYAD